MNGRAGSPCLWQEAGQPPFVGGLGSNPVPRCANRGDDGRRQVPGHDRFNESGLPRLREPCRRPTRCRRWGPNPSRSAPADPVRGPGAGSMPSNASNAGSHILRSKDKPCQSTTGGRPSKTPEVRPARDPTFIVLTLSDLPGAGVVVPFASSIRAFHTGHGRPTRPASSIFPPPRNANRCGQPSAGLGTLGSRTVCCKQRRNQ